MFGSVDLVARTVGVRSSRGKPMGIVISGITLISQSPWTAEQKAAVHTACREVLQALNPERVPSDEEVASYLEGHLEAPHSVVVYGQPCAYTAYWQFYDDDPEL